MNLTGAAVREVLANKSKGMVYLAGLKFTYKDGTDPNRREVLDVVLTDGTPLDPAKTYKVVTNNFMATGGDNYAAFKTGTQVFDTNILIRDAIVNYIKAENAAGRPIAPVIDGRATQVK
jgi:2',3'-cyclic-nucleotide 2'-phosphodiesterase (5'-nucleotidase family)